MSASLTRTTCHGFDAVVIQNALCRATIIPSLGGRIWEFEDLVRGRQWLWHRRDVPLGPAPANADYDAVWAGGWEELFPNDAAGAFEGRHLPDHGEWWTLAWEPHERIEHGTAHLDLTTVTSSRRTRSSKHISLSPDEPTLRVSYRIESTETEPFHFLFKQHLPVALTPGCRLVVPGGMVEPVDPDFGNLLATREPTAWPATTTPTGDLRSVPPPSSGKREFVYIRDLPSGWCGVDDHDRGASLRFEFDRTRMPFLWLFLSYGGWRGCHTAVLEPCTNLPKDLDEAVRRGQAERLVPGTPFEASVAVTLGPIAGER